MVKKIIFDTDDNLWNDVIRFKLDRDIKNSNLALEELIKIGLKSLKEPATPFTIQSEHIVIDQLTMNQIKDFYDNIKTLEKRLGKGLTLFWDKKTDAIYTECHILAEDFLKVMDIDAVIDPEFQEEFRANRQLREQDMAFLRMVEDANEGRQFSDIVIEYNKEYKPNKPLKVIGGQHRSVAIERAFKNQINRYHGIRVYFNLDKDKRTEIYEVSNTNIQVPTDLLDRLEEQRLDPLSKLRNWCYRIGILERGKDFGERRSIEEALPTVRMMRTFIVNFYKGKEVIGNFDQEALVSYTCRTGGIDPEYYKIFKKIESFEAQNDLVITGENFAKLHKKQFAEASKIKEVGKKEYRIKVLSLAVVSSWAFVAGLLQRDEKRLQKLYNLPDFSDSSDPLNAEAMSQAKSDQFDPPNYRGLGTRTDAKDRGRLVQLFLGYSKSDKKTITLEMCNAAIKFYHAKILQEKAEKAF
jgi:hypothetical protein